MILFRMLRKNLLRHARIHHDLEEFFSIKETMVKQLQINNYQIGFHDKYYREWTLKDLCKRKLASEKLLRIVIPKLRKQINNLMYSFFQNNQNILSLYSVYKSHEDDCFELIDRRALIRPFYLNIQLSIVDNIYKLFVNIYYINCFSATKHHKLVMKSFFNIYMECIDWLFKQHEYVINPYFKPNRNDMYDFI